MHVLSPVVHKADGAIAKRQQPLCARSIHRSVQSAIVLCPVNDPVRHTLQAMAVLAVLRPAHPNAAEMQRTVQE